MFLFFFSKSVCKRLCEFVEVGRCVCIFYFSVLLTCNSFRELEELLDLEEFGEFRSLGGRKREK